jgi:hypothetical protein
MTMLFLSQVPMQILLHFFILKHPTKKKSIYYTRNADVVMMLHRNREETETKLIIMKHRNGPTGLIDLEFISSIASFKETASVSKNFD